MEISGAFLQEVEAQRREASAKLGQARSAGDLTALADARARLDDLDELLARNSGEALDALHAAG
jgi:transcription elongation GreA/GreB family factor